MAGVGVIRYEREEEQTPQLRVRTHSRIVAPRHLFRPLRHSAEPNSEPVHLDGGLLNSIADQEGRDLGALITLELDYLAHLLVFNESAIAGEFL